MSHPTSDLASTVVPTTTVTTRDRWTTATLSTVVTVLGVALATVVGVGTGLLLGGLAGTVLAFTVSMGLFASAPTVGFAVARWAFDARRSPTPEFEESY